MTQLNLVLLGPPGAGKGTQAARMREDLGLSHIATGDLLRRHRSEGTDLGEQAAAYMADGQLVPDDLVVAMIREEIATGADGGFLLDGFPRTIAQADALTDALSAEGSAVTAVLLIDAPDELLTERISGRRMCPAGHVFHVKHNPPIREGICDRDGESLRLRDDDRAETVRQRLDVYHEVTEPLASYYEEHRLLHRIDGTRSADAVYEAIQTVVGRIMTGAAA